MDSNGDTVGKVIIADEAASRSEQVPRWPQRFLFVATVIGLLLVALYVTQPDALAALAVIPSWCFVFPAAVLLLETRDVLRSTAWIGFLATLLVYCLICVEPTLSLLRGSFELAPQASALPRWRIVSLNCYVGTTKVIDDLKQLQPDLVLLQETPSQAEVEEMARTLWGEGGAAVCGPDCSIMARGILKLVPATPDARFLQARWHADDRELHVVSLRLTPPNTRIDLWRPSCWQSHTARRLRHRQEIAELAAAIEGLPADTPILLGGDFNSPAGDRSHDPLRARLNDPYARSGRGWGRTFSREFPFHRIDQIWLSPHLRPLQTGAVRAEYSDHRMAVCDVEQL